MNRQNFQRQEINETRLKGTRKICMLSYHRFKLKYDDDIYDYYINLFIIFDLINILCTKNHFVQESEKNQLKSFNDRSSKIIFENNGVQQANVNVSNAMKNVNKQELSNEFARLGDDEKEEKRRIVVKLNENSNLFVRPGTIHRIVFDVTNNHYQTIRCDFRVRSIPLIIFNIQPIL